MLSIALPVPVRLCRAEAGNRAVDDAWIDRSRKRVADAEPVERARAEVLDDDVRLPNKIGEHLAAPRLFQIEGDAVLAAQPVQRRHRDVVFAFATEGHPVRSEIGRVLPAGIRCAGVLDLDDASAESGQQEGSERPGQSVSEIEDRETGQRARWRGSLSGWLSVSGYHGLTGLTGLTESVTFRLHGSLMPSGVRTSLTT